MADGRLTAGRRAGVTPVVRVWVASLLILAGGGLCGCGSGRSVPGESALPAELVSQARPIGRGTGFHPPARGPVIGECRAQLGHRIGAHVEVFAVNRVVLVASGIGTRPPRALSAGRDLEGAVLWRSGDAGADGRCPGATRRARTGRGSVSLVGSATVEQAAWPVRGREGPTVGGLRRRSTLARLARGRAIGATF